jgi:hypothetical protein
MHVVRETCIVVRETHAQGMHVVRNQHAQGMHVAIGHAAMHNLCQMSVRFFYLSPGAGPMGGLSLSMVVVIIIIVLLLLFF